MKKSARDLLYEEIRREIKNLSTLEPGSEKHTSSVENLSKLYRLMIEETKNDYDYDDKFRRCSKEDERYDRDISLREKQLENDREYHEQDDKFRKSQMSEQKKDRYFRLGIEAAGIILPLMFYASWMRRGFKFEETGSFTSTTFKNLFQKFKPTKK